MKKQQESSMLQEPGRVYEYYAFISYKHLDKTWARWTQKQLEHYRLPNRLCREQNMPKHVTPVFRDETDLTGGKTVYDLLYEKIRQSKFLIVICSRNMQVNPQYIDYEIETFLAAGNPSARILPLIVDGEANSADPSKECLPPSLKRMAKDMPLGITVNRKNRKEAILKLIACILELDIQALRSHNQERNQRRIMAALGLGMTFSLGLGAFMAWEVLSVKQAGLREQLTYAADTFRQGDRLDTQAMADEVAESYTFLMDGEIQTEAGKLSLLSAIHPKYQPLTRLCEATDDSRLMFDSSGEHVLVVTENTVRKYDMQGREVMSFDISQTAQRIVDVSADGVHAVVMSIYQYQLAGTHLWLWNMEENSLVCHLTESTRYGVDNEKVGYLSGVVNAQFSPDGSVVCAYADAAGGYFNVNEELAAWDVKTGEKLFSFPGELLGDGEVKAFEFIDNATLHWTGASNHVYYTLGDEAPVVISERAKPSIREQKRAQQLGENAPKTVTVGHMRYTYTYDKINKTGLITDLHTGDTLSLELPGGTCYYQECGGRYLLLFVINEENELAPYQEALRLVDLQQMQEMTCIEPFSELSRGWDAPGIQLTAPGNAVYLTYSTGGMYRLDLTSGAYLPINVTNAADYEVIASTDRMDVLAAEQDGLLQIVEVEGASIRSYAVDETYAQFTSTAVYSSASAYMAAKHNGSYYLYPLEHPGQQLDRDIAFTGESMYACSADGQLVVKAGGSALAMWKEDALLLQTQLEDAVRCVGAAKEYAFALTDSSLLLYDDTGMQVNRLDAAADERFFSAKITADGRRIALVKGSAGVFSDNAYDLLLLDGANLAQVSTAALKMHVIPAAAYESAYDLSPDGKWVSAVIRNVNEEDEKYQLSVGVWATEDGRMHAMTENDRDTDVPQFDMMNFSSGISSSYRLQYVKFAANGYLLTGLQYGAWVFDVENVRTVDFLMEGTSADALPDMTGDHQLIYPSNGLHVWDVATGKLEAVLAHQVAAASVNESVLGENINAMIKAQNQHRLYISGNQQWAAITGKYGAWLYNTEDWSSNTMLVSQPARILYLDEKMMIYATSEGLWRLVHTRNPE